MTVLLQYAIAPLAIYTVTWFALGLHLAPFWRRKP